MVLWRVAVIPLVVCQAHNVKLMEDSVTASLVWWVVHVTLVIMDFMDFLLLDASLVNVQVLDLCILLAI